MHATLCKKWHGLFWQVDPKKRQVKVTPCLHFVEKNFQPNSLPLSGGNEGENQPKIFQFYPSKYSSLKVKVG